MASETGLSSLKTRVPVKGLAENTLIPSSPSIAERTFRVVLTGYQPAAKPGRYMQRWSTILCRTFRSSAELQAREFTGDKPAAKAVLYDILHKSAEPLTSTQIWEQAETAGIKSKRHVKQLLSAMRQAAVIQTRPMGKGKNFVYKLRNVTAKAVEAQIGKRPQESPVSTA